MTDHDTKELWRMSLSEYTKSLFGENWVVVRQRRQARDDETPILRNTYKHLLQKHRSALVEAIVRGDDVPDHVLWGHSAEVVLHEVRDTIWARLRV